MTRISFHPIAPTIGVEVRGLDLATPPNDEEFTALRRAWTLATILLIRGQRHLRPEDLIAFGRRLGELDEHDQPQYTLQGYPEIALVSNIKENGRYIGAPNAGRHWHSDAQYLRCPPSGSLLWAKEVPSTGGNTMFANMFAAFDALEPVRASQLSKLQVEFSRVRAYERYHPERPPLSEEEKQRLPDVRHPILRTHPENGRTAIYVGGEAHGGRVVGMQEAEGDKLMQELREAATQKQFVYEHVWQAGDAILWDNRSTLHCALPFDDVNHRRLMYRVQIAGDEPMLRPL